MGAVPAAAGGSHVTLGRVCGDHGSVSLDEHGHFIARIRPDGSLTDDWDDAPDDRTPIGVTACTCGWRGPLTDVRPDHDDQDESSLEDWDLYHFAPMVTPEIGRALLVYLAHDGHLQHVLAGRTVPDGAELELLLADGTWLRGTFRAELPGGDGSGLAIRIGGPWDEHGIRDYVHPVVLPLPDPASLRWVDPPAPVT